MKKVDLMVLIMVIAGHPSNSVKDHNSINFIMEIITGYSIDASIWYTLREMLLINTINYQHVIHNHQQIWQSSSNQ